MRPGSPSIRRASAPTRDEGGGRSGGSNASDERAFDRPTREDYVPGRRMRRRHFSLEGVFPPLRGSQQGKDAVRSRAGGGYDSKIRDLCRIEAPPTHQPSQKPLGFCYSPSRGECCCLPPESATYAESRNQDFFNSPHRGGVSKKLRFLCRMDRNRSLRRRVTASRRNRRTSRSAR